MSHFSNVPDKYIKCSFKCFYFDHNDVALANIAKWFQQRSDERRNYAIRLMRQQNARGGRVALQNVRKPERDEWGSPLDAFESALVLEKFSNASFLELHKLAASSNDAQVLIICLEMLDFSLQNISEVFGTIKISFFG